MTTYFVHRLVDFSGHKLIGRVRAASISIAVRLAKKRFPKLKKNLMVSENQRLRVMRRAPFYPGFNSPFFGQTFIGAIFSTERFLD